MDKPIFEKGFDALASKPREHHDFRPDINGLRALAVLSVLAFHAGLPAPGGFAGVDIFFVISGFLISRIILSERTAGNFSLAGFYGKRVKRILPALLLTLFSVWIAGWFLFNIIEFRLLGGHMEGSSYFSVNLWLYRQASGPAAYFDWKSRLLPLLHLWSLSIEEQFYVVWPALILLLFRVRRLLTPAIALIFVASLAYCIVMTDVNSTAAFYLLSSRAWELALGALLAEREVFWKPSSPSPLVANLGAGAGIVLMLLTIFWLVDSDSSWPGYLALAPTLGCALVIASPGAKISRILFGNRVAQFFGLISYPLYLWHWPLLSFAHSQVGKDLPGALTAALLATSVLLAWLTFRFVERPIAAAYTQRPLRVAILLLVGLALAGALGVATRVSDGFAQRFPRVHPRDLPLLRPRRRACMEGIGLRRQGRQYPRSAWKGAAEGARLLHRQRLLQAAPPRPADDRRPRRFAWSATGFRRQEGLSRPRQRSALVGPGLPAAAGQGGEASRQPALRGR